jgi:ATP-dependent protease HslVU (ClpYQ) peptidase subunit
MTVIAWDGTTLAADRRCSFGAYIGTLTKIRRIGNALVGVAGSASKAGEFFAWIESGAYPPGFPPRDNGNDYFTGLVIRPGPIVERYECTGFPIVLEDKQHAIGSGRDYAAMAMHLGKSASEAVQLATMFDENCGNGVDELSFGQDGG